MMCKPSLEQDVKDVRWAELSADLEELSSENDAQWKHIHHLSKRVAALEDGLHKVEFTIAAAYGAVELRVAALEGKQ